MKTSIFNIKRFGLLLRNDLFRNYRTLLIGAGSVAAIYLIIILVPMIFSRDCVGYDFHQGFFPTALFIFGFLLSAASFADIHHTQKNTAFFMLPASRLEKLTSRLLLTGILFVVISVIFYYLLNLLSIVLATIFGCGPFPVFHLFNREMLTVLLVYLITQSVFLFGSIYFKSHALMKTGLSLFALANVIGLFSLLVVRIVFYDFFNHMHAADNFMATDFLYLKDIGETLLTILKYLFYFVLAPYFWVLSYIRLGEKEV